ncbi:thioredoxin-domain-containing protein [Saccharata proteae CBS 121410]|uniref:Thioredoxin-domain-containing protein n=1 Tax=Saccharata proteae CBS 121410 TaxID=1314787 RepID=A0A6A5YDV7_9PEZI|nr:thioredoxin-domain-containing protein [Saccharata proteae CBS 121410]
MSKITHINSTAQFNTLLSSNTYVVVDFHAQWCGPCKTIAPIFEQLATAEAKPGRIAFAKVDVDSQQGIAQQYGVSAMPTFLIFKNSSVSETIRGANPAALRSAVLKCSADAAKGPGRQSASFTSKGHVLGSGSGSSSMTRDWGFQVQRHGSLLDTLVRFVALYFTSLFAFDAYQAAQASPFSVQKRS